MIVEKLPEVYNSRRNVRLIKKEDNKIKSKMA